MDTKAKKAGCENCGLRKRTERKPKSLLAMLWRWHTKWCPGWKAYQKELARRNADGDSTEATR